MPALLEKPQRTAAHADEVFVVQEHVPVFKEHTNRDGVPFDRRAMERIAARCNERIRDTGDFPTIVLRPVIGPRASATAGCAATAGVDSTLVP